MAARGEGTIIAEGREVNVLFTNRALMQAEKVMGKSVIAVTQGFVNGTAGMNELVALLQAGMEAARRDSGERGRVVTLNDATEVLEEAGFTAVAQVVMESVAAVLSYSVSDNGNEPDPN
jgi:hypothetical protein